MMMGNPNGLGMMPGQFYRMPQMGGDLGLEEEPLYVNAKQYHRILKRRQARAALETRLRIQKGRVSIRARIKHSCSCHLRIGAGQQPALSA